MTNFEIGDEVEVSTLYNTTIAGTVVGADVRPWSTRGTVYTVEVLHHSGKPFDPPMVAYADEMTRVGECPVHTPVVNVPECIECLQLRMETRTDALLFRLRLLDLV
jgi:hypothetical protein